MNLISIQFVLFIVLILGVYHLLNRRSQNIWLLIASYIFVFSWAWEFAVILFLATAANFLIALRLDGKYRDRRVPLWIGIGFNVFILIQFRFANFFLPELLEWLARLGIPTQAGGLQILIPLGLSFYTLQAISYLVDVHRGQLAAESDPVKFALYLAYFPKIIAGPIERARSFLPILANRRVVDRRLLARSVMLVLLGIFRKLIIADPLAASMLTDVFEFPAKYNPPELILWLLIFGFALYNDFAGYTDIVRGISGFFGIELSSNFHTPHFSRTFTEFWRRWHISLSEWLRDYIYFPLSRILRRWSPNQISPVNLILPPMVTMLVSGLWHGISLNMLIWGGLHGLYLIVERVLALWRPVVPPQNQPKWRQWLGMGIVFTFVNLAWIPFSWELSVVFDFWGALLDWTDVAIRYRRLFLVIPFIIGSLVIDLLQYRSEDEYIFLKWRPSVQAACMAILLLLIFIATGGDFKLPFVYQAF